MTTSNTLISIPPDGILTNRLEFGKGEIVYFSNIPLGTHVFERLISGQIDMSSSTKVDLISIRKNIGHINDDNYLWSSLSAKENLELYLESIGMRSASNQEFVNRLGIEWTKKVDNLEVTQRHLLQIAIGLSKDPEIILYDSTSVHTSLPIYNKIMSVLYNLVKDKGLTLLSNISSSDLIERYPGRIIE